MEAEDDGGGGRKERGNTLTEDGKDPTKDRQKM
jgi:hypothetical protein